MHNIYNNNKNQQKLEKNTQKKIRTNNSNESIHLSLVLASEIFIPRAKGYPIDEIVTGELKRTESEHISYRTPPLDILTDFPLFSIVVSKFQREKTSSFILTEYEIYNALGRNREQTTSKGYSTCFDKLKESEINLEIKTEGQIKNYKTNLIMDWDWDSKGKCFMFQMNEIFLDFYIEGAQYERIYADKYKSINSGYAKALYLYLETMKFKNNLWVKFNENEKLKKRFGNNIKRNADKNRKLKEALLILKREDVIFEYFSYKSKVDGQRICKIYRDGDSFIHDSKIRDQKKHDKEVLDKEMRNKDSRNKKIRDKNMHERNYTEHQKKLRQRIIDHNNKDDIIIPIPLEFEQPINFDESF
jgi:hypothetical protein